MNSIKKVITGNRIAWLDSCKMPSRIHRTIDNGNTTICGHTPRKIGGGSGGVTWEINSEVPRSSHGHSKYCQTCFKNGGKTLLWIKS